MTPAQVVLSNWIEDGAFTPGIGFFEAGDEARAVARAPLKATTGARLFVANQDYGYKNGWAVGGLQMAEKILQEELGLPKPAWLDEDWYARHVKALP